MKRYRAALLLFLAATPAIRYFKYERPASPATSNGQHFVTLDETIWEHAVPGLHDLRLYSGGHEVPYALASETGDYESSQKPLRILQPGTLAGKTRFLLDMSGVEEYDRVQLGFVTRNFVAHAKVEGQDDAHANNWTALGTTTLYDLSEEKLGRNNTLQIPLSTFRFLRVTVDGSLKPSALEGATAGVMPTHKAAWRNINSQAVRDEHGRESVFTFMVAGHMPVERVNFTFAPEQPNFSRTVRILGDNDQEVGSGELTKIHLQRNGQKIDCDQTSIGIHQTASGKYRVVVSNGDDPPLRSSDARLQQYERRLYFDSEAGSEVRLYYGDEKLESPIYDYAKIFRKDPSATALQLGSEVSNATYVARPDDRPWSERYPAVLWAAIIAAVLVLGGIAFRSLKSTGS